MNKKAFNPSDYLIGIVIFTLVIMAGSSMILSFISSDPTFMSSSELHTFNSTFSKYNEIQTLSNNLRDSTLNSSMKTTTLGVLDGLITTAWGTIKQLGLSVSFMNGALSGLADILEIPMWVISLLISIIAILIVFALYKLIFQGGEI